MQTAMKVTPEKIFRTLNAFQQSAALQTGIELDVFSKIAAGNKSAKEIAGACGASERGVRILCDTLTVLEFLHKEQDQYRLTESSAVFLDRKSPAFIGGAIEFLMSDKLRQGFDQLTDAVIKGGSTVDSEGSLDPESPMWVKFARGMMGMMVPPAQMMAEKLDFEIDRKLKVLDIAAGHGIFGITIAQKYTNAEIYAVDWANVLDVASENAENFGVAERHHRIEGSAFDVEYGDGYDIVLLTNFLHHFDVATCERLLKKIHGSLNEDGRILTLEFVPNDDRVSPPVEAMFSLVMLAGTPAGDAYTFSEISRMFENSGFSRNQHVPLEPLPQHLIISSK